MKSFHSAIEPIEDNEYFEFGDSMEFGPLLVEDDAMEDWHIASYGIDKLNSTSPFFLALGFRKPHLPWFVPKRYYDMYPLEDIQLPTVLENDLDDIPIAGRNVAFTEEKDYQGMIEEAGEWPRVVRGYLAATTFVDAQIGRFLDALDQVPEVKENTIVVFLGDHGYHHGQKRHWMKNTLWEEATRAPYVWVVPGSSQAGQVC